jgi:hypothetical protein
MKTTREISNKVRDMLASIIIANGNLTDIGSKIHRGRLKPVNDEAEVPCMSIIEGHEEVLTTSHNIQADRTVKKLANVRQEYIIVGFDKCDPDDPLTRAHDMLEDIGRVMFRGGLALDTFKDATIEYRGQDVGTRADGVAIVSAIMHVEVTFAKQL